MTKSPKLIYKRADYFSRLAKQKGYRSRSSIKLLEIQKKDQFIKVGAIVLDLGSSPGGWSQVTKQIVGRKGSVFGVDFRDMKPIKGVTFIRKSLEELVDKDFEVKRELINNLDVVLSDIAPNLSGIGLRDDASMIELLGKIQDSINVFLKEEGAALVKVFQGESLDQMMIYMKSKFQKVRIRKPISSRSNSSETYVLGLDKKK